jgi:hypothetical protein
LNTTEMIDEHVIDYRTAAHHKTVYDSNRVLNSTAKVSYRDERRPKAYVNGFH